MKIQRILANNPGPFTGPGTNTWLLDDGRGVVVVIDPGPLDSVHEESIVQTLGSRNVAYVLVTHTHPDHAPMANPLAKNLGVGAIGYEPGPGFVPDRRVSDGDLVRFGSARLEVIHTPGHSSDHLCFRVDDIAFTGDHIMGGSSVMVENMGPYLESLRAMKGIGLERLLPGHGPEMEEADTVIDWYLAHRLARHREILDAVVSGHNTVDEIVDFVYQDVDTALHLLAARSVEAHLGLLSEEGRIAWEGARLICLDSSTQ